MSSSSLEKSEYNKMFIRSDIGKFVPMSLLMFCILFNQNILRILKDSILISEVSAEITSFTKLYYVTPLSALFVILYAKLVNNLSFQKIFYHLISVFIGFYILFGFVIYPNIDVYHMDQEKLSAMMISYPHLKWYIATLGNWSYVLFYAFSELWPNIFYLLLFWQVANEYTSTSEAKRFYALLPLFGNLALIVVGILMMNLSRKDSLINNFFSSSNKITLVQISTVMLIISSILSCILVRYITRNMSPMRIDKKNMSKPKMGLMDSFKYIIRSKYLWLMLICTASFGLSMNLVEAVWKAKLREFCGSVNAYAEFHATYILWTGVAIIIMTIMGNNMMRNRSWFVVAIITPIIIFVTGVLFFCFVVFDEYILNILDGIILVSPLALAVFVGTIQNILSKGSKYSIWDTSRQMLYIPLDSELRTKGKAAVDVISPKIGKSVSAFIQSMTFTIFPASTYHSIAPTLMFVFVVVCVFWIYAIRKIYFEYQKVTSN